MYSTLLFLDRPRHLRYDLQAIVDLDQLLPGGFKTIFYMPSNLESLKIIFWAGLKHEENLTFDDVERILKDSKWEIEKLVEIFSRTIWDQGWISKSNEKSDKPVTIENLISGMEEVNYRYLHLSPKEFYAITPQEFVKMLEVWNEKSDRDLALLCATTAQCSGATKSGGIGFTIEDFMPQKEKSKQSSKQMANLLMGAW